MLLPQIFRGWMLHFNSGLCALLWTTSTLWRQEETDSYQLKISESVGLVLSVSQPWHDLHGSQQARRQGILRN